MPPIDLDADVLAVQRAYPRIYQACHVQHVRRHTTRANLSARDASILAHLDDSAPVSAGKLARHLGLAASTLSEALEELERLGYVERARSMRDRRSVLVSLTRAGVAAVAAGSVLDSARLATCLARLSERERAVAIKGITLIACACARES